MMVRTLRVLLFAACSAALACDQQAAVEEETLAAPPEGAGGAGGAGRGPAAGEGGPPGAPSDLGPGAEAADASGIGTVEAVVGEPLLVRGEERGPLLTASKVSAGDRIETGAGHKARLVLADGSVLSIGGKTTLTLETLEKSATSRKGRAAIEVGKFWAKISDFAGGESLWEIATPNAVAGVRGTTLWGDTEVDAICALEGTIEVRSVQANGATTTKKKKKKEKKEPKPKTLEAGQCVSKLSKGKQKPLKPKPKQVEKYLDEVLIR